MNDINIKNEAVKQAQSEEGQKLMQQLLEAKSPVLANANDLAYKAYKRPYLGNTSANVLIILANGYYYPTPQVDLYFEEVYGKFEYKLMQNNSNAGFFLATYHSAQFTSGAGYTSLPDSIVIEDAYGKHTIKVESY